MTQFIWTVKSSNRNSKILLVITIVTIIITIVVITIMISFGL